MTAGSCRDWSQLELEGVTASLYNASVRYGSNEKNIIRILNHHFKMLDSTCTCTCLIVKHA